jgi:hypothetical protein
MLGLSAAVVSGRVGWWWLLDDSNETSLIFRVLLCLPTALTLPLNQETSARFFGQLTHRKPTPVCTALEVAR